MLGEKSLDAGVHAIWEEILVCQSIRQNEEQFINNFQYIENGKIYTRKTNNTQEIIVIHRRVV